MASMTDRFRRLYLHEKSAISVEQLDAEYILHLDAQTSQNLGSEARLAATSSSYSVRLYSRHNLATMGVIQGHDDIVSSVRFTHSDTNTLYTASHDGTIKQWDLRTDFKKPSNIFKGYEETNNIFTAFDIGSKDRLLCSGTEGNKDGDTHLIFWDSRSGEPLGVYENSHQDDITQVHFHPTLTDKLITSSTDGLMNVFDVSQQGEDDALMTSLNAECAIAQIGWCGPDQQHAFCLTTIESLHIWETATDQFDTIVELTDVRNTYKGADIDYMVDCFQPEDSEVPLLLLGDKKGGMYVASVEGNALTHRLTLDSAHKDIVRCLNYDRKTQTLVTGGEDAMLCLWSPQPVTTQRHTASTFKVKTKSKIKSKLTKVAKPF